MYRRSHTICRHAFSQLINFTDKFMTLAGRLVIRPTEDAPFQFLTSEPQILVQIILTSTAPSLASGSSCSVMPNFFSPEKIYQFTFHGSPHLLFQKNCCAHQHSSSSHHCYLLIIICKGRSQLFDIFPCRRHIVPPSAFKARAFIEGLQK